MAGNSRATVHPMMMSPARLKIQGMKTGRYPNVANQMGLGDILGLIDEETAGFHDNATDTKFFNKELNQFENDDDEMMKH